MTAVAFFKACHLCHHCACGALSPRTMAVCYPWYSCWHERVLSGAAGVAIGRQAYNLIVCCGPLLATRTREPGACCLVAGCGGAASSASCKPTPLQFAAIVVMSGVGGEVWRSLCGCWVLQVSFAGCYLKEPAEAPSPCLPAPVCSWGVCLGAMGWWHGRCGECCGHKSGYQHQGSHIACLSCIVKLRVLYGNVQLADAVFSRRSLVVSNQLGS